jgi:hypothetical protein
MALLTALMASLMMLALGAGVVVTSTTETAIAAHHRDGIQAIYVAEAGIALAVNRLAAVDDWRTVIDGCDAVTWVDGRLADLLQSGSVDARSNVSVTVSPDPGGDADALMMQSSAIVAGGIRRTVQVTVHKRPSGDIDVTSWR